MALSRTAKKIAVWSSISSFPKFKTKEISMFNQSPMETLASFAIAFAAGAASVVLVSAYGQWMKHQGRLLRNFS